MKCFVFIILLILIIHSVTFKVKADSTTVFISEILPDGAGADAGKEWIELYNNSTDPINVKDYFFINRSASGSERKITISSILSIPPKQFYLISEAAQNISSENILILGSGKINMYNDESDLELYDSDSALVDAVHYPKPTEAKSLERKGPENILDCNKLVINANGNTILTDNLNRDPVCFGQEPVSAPVNPPTNSCLPISLLTSSLANSTVCTTGYISVEPNILGDKVFYIQDGGVGMKVKLKDTPSVILKLGDKVKITGTLKSVQDGLYLYVDSLILLGNNLKLFPTLLTNNDSQKYSLVEYTGTIIKNYSKSIDLSYGDSTIRVSVLASTNIEMPTRTVGDNLKVTGILVEEGGIFKILPRYQEDLEIQEKEETETVTTIQPKSDSVTKTSSTSKEVPEINNVVVNKLPSLAVNKVVRNDQVFFKYSISRTWFILLLIILLLVLIIIINRRRIIEFIRKIHLVELKLDTIETEQAQTLNFEKDKYELMFGGVSSLEGG